MSAAKKLRDELAAFRARMLGSFPVENRDMALLQILRCVDDETFTNYIYQNAGKERPNSKYYKEVSLLYGWGLNEALTQFWPAGELLGFPKFETTEHLFKWADSVLQCSGRVRLIEQFLELERIKLGSLKQTEGDSNTFDFFLSQNATGIESVERDEGNFHASKVEEVQEKTGAWKKLESRRQAIMDLMQTLVEVSPNQFIRYDTTPEIDAFYSELANLVAPTREGWDAFPLDTRFGKFKFADYLECVQAQIGFAYKHIDYCVLLSSRNQQIKPVDIMALPCNWQHACRFMSYAMGETEEDATALMETTALSFENAEHHLKVPAGPFPSHYRFGKNCSVRLITGCLHNPFHFLLRELQRRFRPDWDKAVDSREHLFRMDLVHSFAKFKRVFFHPENIKIKTSLGQTDIDVLLLDPISKVAGLFQLKWQDPFCGSMRERESRKQNFLGKGNEWVGKVFAWIDSNQLQQMLESVGLPRAIASEIKLAKVFVLGRNFSQFSGDFQTDSRAAWGHWAQVQRLLEKLSPDYPAPICKLFELLNQENPKSRAPKPSTMGEIRVGNIKIRIHSYTRKKSD